MRPRVIASAPPSDSLLRARVGPGDFLDCFSVASDMPPRQAAEIVATFPGWARFLLFLRRVATAPFGLSNDGPDAPDKIGPFPIDTETASEVIAGFNDAHLDFRVSIFSQDGRVSLATWVHAHHLGGRLYLAAILPFHILIVRDALRRVASG